MPKSVVNEGESDGDDTQYTEPLAMVEATLDENDDGADGASLVPETRTDEVSCEPQTAGPPTEDSSDYPHGAEEQLEDSSGTSDQQKATDPTSDGRVISSLPKTYSSATQRSNDGNPSASEPSQNFAPTRPLGRPDAENENPDAAAKVVSSPVPAEPTAGTDGNPVEHETVPSEMVATVMEDQVKEETVLEDGEENNVAIASSFSLRTDLTPTNSSTTRDQDDPNGNTSSGGSSFRPNIGYGSCANVTTYYLLSTNRGLNRKCVVPSCIRPLDPHFSFPKDKNLCLKWLIAIPKGNWSLNEHSVVCSRHFERMNISWKQKKANNVTLSADAVPKLFLHSATTSHQKDSSRMSSVAVGPDYAAAAAFTAVGGPSLATTAAPSAPINSSPTAELLPTVPTSAAATGDSPSVPVADISETQDVSLVQQENGVFKIQMNVDNVDNDSESDLEIIEPHIETLEVSDTSDEGEGGSKDGSSGAKDPAAPISIVGMNSRKADVSSTGKLYSRKEDGNVIKCCVPRCGSYTGSPPGVGFHTFPTVGETRLSVRSLDNSVTVHDLCSMWKSLLSVPNVTDDSYVCTRHFTVNDYIYNTLNKAAVPTQFLPTPVMFAPCRVEKPAGKPPPLVVIGNSSTQQAQPNRLPSTIRIRAPTILRGAPRVGAGPRAGAPSTLHQQIQSRIVNHVLTVGQRNVLRIIDKVASDSRVSSTLPRVAPVSGSVRLGLQPRPPLFRIGCAIPDCPNKTYLDGKKPILFRLPTGIEKCKEWVYACGHPEWLDKGMFFARSKFRICSEHFSDEMFLGSDRKMLKGFAKPCIKVQEPYKKCVVKCCHNYYDKERLHHIGVDFSPFPHRSFGETRLIQWIKAVKNTKDEPTEDELDKYENAVICSLHFRNSDYITGPVGKRLGSYAVPTMNLAPKNPATVEDVQEEEEEVEELEADGKKQKRLTLCARRKKKRLNPGVLKWQEERRRLRAAKEKALAEGLPWPPPEEAAKMKEQEEAAKAKDEEETLPKKKRWEQLSPGDHKKQKLDEEGNEGEASGGRTGSPGPSRGKRGGGRRTRSSRHDSEGSTEDESLDGSCNSESEGRQLRFGRKALPPRQASKNSKKSKYAETDDGESSSSSRRRRKQPRLEDETIYSPVTRRSARAAAAKNKKIYEEDSESQQEGNGDQGVPDEDDNARDEVERPQGTHFLDPDFGRFEDMAMDGIENCLETVLEEQPGNRAVQQQPESAPQEDASDGAEVEKQTNESEKPEESPTVDAVNAENEESAEGRHLRFGRKARQAKPVTKQRLRHKGRFVKSKPGETDAPVEPEQEAKQPVDVGNADGKVPVPAEIEPDAKEPSTKDRLAAPDEERGTTAVEPVVEEPQPSRKEISAADLCPGNQDEEISHGQSVSRPPDDKSSTPVEEPRVASDSLSPNPSLDDSKENDGAHSVVYGPKMAVPTQADVEFFRSIIPTMAKFSQHQRAVLKATVLSTLKDMLGEDTGIKLNSTEALLKELPLPSCLD